MPITDKPSPATRDAYAALVRRVGIVKARQMISDQIRERRPIGSKYGARPGQDAINGTERRNTRRKLTDADLAAIQRSLDDGLKLRAIANAMWEEKGYSSPESAYNCMKTALRTRRHAAPASTC